MLYVPQDEAAIRLAQRDPNWPAPWDEDRGARTQELIDYYTRLLTAPVVQVNPEAQRKAEATVDDMLTRGHSYDGVLQWIEEQRSALAEQGVDANLLREYVTRKLEYIFRREGWLE